MVAINRMKNFLRVDDEQKQEPPSLPEQEPVRDNRWWVLAVVGAFVAGLFLGR